jgi:hypothetical protein
MGAAMRAVRAQPPDTAPVPVRPAHDAEAWIALMCRRAEGRTVEPDIREGATADEVLRAWRTAALRSVQPGGEIACAARMRGWP